MSGKTFQVNLLEISFFYLENSKNSFATRLVITCVDVPSHNRLSSFFCLEPHFNHNKTKRTCVDVIFASGHSRKNEQATQHEEHLPGCHLDSEGTN